MIRTSIRPIGNSSGLILPAEVLRKLSLSRNSDVFLDIKGDSILIKPAPRQGWAEDAKRMSLAGNDELLLPDFFEDENLDWWQWEEK